MKKSFSIILLSCIVATIFNTPILAASVNGAADINDLMGQRPNNSYYQNPSSSSQTQGTADVLNSVGGVNILQQPATGGLKVTSPIITTTPTSVEESSNWKLFAILAAAFFVVAVILFVVGVNARKSVKQIVEYELPKVKAVVAKKMGSKPKKVSKKTKKRNDIFATFWWQKVPQKATGQTPRVGKELVKRQQQPGRTP